MEQRFSVIKHASVTVHPDGTKQAQISREVLREHREQSFQDLVEEVRNILVSGPGRSEAERSHRNDLLNRAVLGYPDERRQMIAIINDVLVKRRIHDLPSSHTRFESLSEAIFAEVIGMDVLEILLKNKAGLEEIQVIGTQIFEVRSGMPKRSSYEFATPKDVERIQQNLVLYNQDSFNPRKRWAEVMLSDGSRVTMTGFGYTALPTLTIRFYERQYFDLQALCHPACGTIDETVRHIMLTLIRSYFNMVIIGPTNSGKSNLLKALIREMPDNERIITIESRREMMLGRDFPHKNIIEYEADEYDEQHSAAQAFKLALRQSPQRICHAEIRDQDANIYVRACTRGHAGSLTTVHANSLEDIPEVITDMCMLDGRALNAVRLTKRIAQFVAQIAIEMAIVQGQRKIVRIGELGFIHDQVIVREIVTYDYERNRWRYPTAFSPSALQRIRRYDEAGFQMLQSLIQVGINQAKVSKVKVC